VPLDNINDSKEQLNTSHDWVGCSDLPNKTARNSVELKELGETGFYYKYFRPKQESLRPRSGFFHQA
jgi:hypothetical protein